MAARRHPFRPARRPLLWPVEDVTAPHGWVATPGFWHVRASTDDVLATLCGINLRDGLTNRAPESGEAVCRRCMARAAR